MRTLVFGSVGLFGVLACYVACGGTVVEVAGGPDATTLDSAAPVDATAKLDAATLDAETKLDTGLPMRDGGGGVATPNAIACGANTCGLPAQFCCTTQAGVQSCSAAGVACNSGAPQLCDDKADCPGAEKCCLSAGAGGTSVAIKCAPACGKVQGIDLPQLCNTDAECGADACETQMCNGRTLKTCGGLSPLVASFICR